MNDATELFVKFDIVIIGESHFKIRIKCPIGKSKTKLSKKGRGGVAVYRKFQSRVKLIMISDDFPDAVLFEIEGSNIIIAAIYITPSNNIYFNDKYFQNLKILLDLYVLHQTIIIIGDLNARMANDFSSKGITYQSYPDENKNPNCKTLKEIIDEYDDILLINGLQLQNKSFDSKFTFYRGRLKSQIDVCLSNNVDILNEFHIMDKLYFSDHCPISLKFDAKISYPYQLLSGCAKGVLNYSYYEQKY